MKLDEMNTYSKGYRSALNDVKVLVHSLMKDLEIKSNYRNELDIDSVQIKLEDFNG